VKSPLSSGDRPAASGGLRNAFFTVAVTGAFVLGLYSLFLASVNAGKVKPLTTEGMRRTAIAKDSEQIAIAIGSMIDSELVYVVVDAPQVGPDPDLESAARQAAQALVDSGLVVSVRRLEPADPEFLTIVAKNSIGRFPAVLLVKKDGGIVLVTDDLSQENLLHAYHTVWGKSSDCGGDKNAVY